MKKSYLVIAGLLLVACIWRAPLSPWVRLNFEYALLWSATVALSYLIATRINLLVGLFLILATFSSHYPGISKYSVQAHRMVLAGVIWYSVCVWALDGGKGIGWVLDAICIIALANVVMLVCQYFNFDPIHYTVKTKYESQQLDLIPNVGLMSCHNGAAAMLAITFPAFLRMKRRWLGFRWVYLFPLPLLGMVIAHTFAGPLAVAISLAVVVFIVVPGLKRKLLVVAGVIFLGALLLGAYANWVDVPDTGWRWNAWKFAIGKLYPQHWIFGSGIGHWKIIYSKAIVAMRTGGDVMAQAHNEFVQGLFEMGIGFALILIGYLISIWKRYRPDALISVMALVAIIVNSMVFFPFHIGLSAMVALTWMAILEVQLET